MRRLPAIVLGCVFLITSCGGSDEPARTETSSCYVESTPEATFGRGRALLDGGGESTLIDVQIADSPDARAQGLMHRETLGEDCGMAFMFFEESSGGFWMKNTLIPLSIAFFDERGTILRILDMEPCEKDPCQIYDPGVSYWGALEVNSGAFDRWGIDEGDRISITQ